MPEPIIHQDIKPDNILVDDSNRYLITDFGISKKIRSTMRKQSKRAVGAGATAYMGPERFESNSTPVKASDIWSLGASIYELATGELPFCGLGGGMQRNGAEMPALDNKWSKDMTMVMQSCLAKETWDRPTAQQLEEFSDAIINGQPAKATWNVPSEKAEGLVSEPSEPDSSSIYGNDDEEGTHSNKKRIWIVIGTIIAAIFLLIVIWPLEKADEQFVTPKDTIKAVDTVGEVSSGLRKIKSTEGTNTKIIQTKSKEETKSTKIEDSKANNNAAILKKALANSDYQKVQKLANQGYTPAYGPLAKYYLINHDYKTAETYAKKAIAVGSSDGHAVIQTLENLGYYD